MNWFGLIKCVIVMALMLALYLILMNTRWKDKFKEYPFAAIGIILLVFCAIGLLARLILHV